MGALHGVARLEQAHCVIRLLLHVPASGVWGARPSDAPTSWWRNPTNSVAKINSTCNRKDDRGRLENELAAGKSRFRCCGSEPWTCHFDYQGMSSSVLVGI